MMKSVQSTGLNFGTGVELIKVAKELGSKGAKALRTTAKKPEFNNIDLLTVSSVENEFIAKGYKVVAKAKNGKSGQCSVSTWGQSPGETLKSITDVFKYLTKVLS